MASASRLTVKERTVELAMESTRRLLQEIPELATVSIVLDWKDGMNESLPCLVCCDEEGPVDASSLTSLGSAADRLHRANMILQQSVRNQFVAIHRGLQEKTEQLQQLESLEHARKETQKQAAACGSPGAPHRAHERGAEHPTQNTSRPSSRSDGS